MESSTANRSTTITFNRPYVFPPNVVVWITALDSESRRRDLARLGCVQLDYLVIAVPADSVHTFAIKSGQFVPDGAKVPVGANIGWTQDVQFMPLFQRVPRVMVALSRVDLGKEADIRIQATPQNVTKDGMTLVIETWDGGILHSAGLGWIAVDGGSN
ncbi:unnamed protein product [Rhizoctonia solani]|uniref:H-type lectin domain-containing protein n=1 Tax=Rhizoctonia solani TaxID=456999 RepID=A0A8H3GGY3_9AGAM|nr:unnamed protein product [Rhizoctonia solani]